MKEDKNNKDDEWWTPFRDSLAGLELRSLRVMCPECNQSGILCSRWIKGPPIKPLYVIHRKDRRACELTDENAKEFRGQIPILKGDVKKLLNRGKVFVLFSGGLDSLATLIYLKQLSDTQNNELTVLYVDTTAGLPANKRYVKRVCNYLDTPLEIVRPEKDYFTLAGEWGIPSYNYRWCCRELKIKPLQKFLATVGEKKVVFDGIRAAESFQRRQYLPIWYHPSFECLSVSPIFYWSKENVLDAVTSNGIPKTILHTIGTSSECWCGAYKTKSDFVRLYERDKNMFSKLANLESNNRNGYTFLYEKGERLSLVDLAEIIEHGTF